MEKCTAIGATDLAFNHKLTAIRMIAAEAIRETRVQQPKTPRPKKKDTSCDSTRWQDVANRRW